MDIKDIQKFAEETEERLSKYYSKSKTEMIPLHALKVGEEAGELFEQVLAHQNFQRKDKTIDKEEIGEELADVLLAAAVLAQSLNIDIERKIQEKIDKNRKRLKD